MHLRVVKNSSGASLMPNALEQSAPGGQVMTDEWGAYRRLPQEGRLHSTVNHGDGEWARDDDGDGIREVHTNTQEGLWTSLRNWLRSFRGVSKKYLQGYVSAFEWIWNRKSIRNADVFDVLLRANISPLTFKPG